MADSGYYDNYQGVDTSNNLLHSIHGFRGAGNLANYGKLFLTSCANIS